MRRAAIVGALMLAPAGCRAVLGIEPLDRAPSDAGVEASADGASEASAADAGSDVDRAWTRWAVSPDGPSSDQFTVDADVIFDSVTRLTWQRDVKNQAPLRWDEAAAACAALSLGGLQGWRLPTRIELISITDYRRVQPATLPGLFDTPSATFWTSSTFAKNPADVWIEDFSDGRLNEAPKTQSFRFRCVHD